MKLENYPNIFEELIKSLKIDVKVFKDRLLPHFQVEMLKFFTSKLLKQKAVLRENGPITYSADYC